VSTVPISLPLLTSGRSHFTGFPNYPRPQLPASKSNSSRWLNLSIFLSLSLTLLIVRKSKSKLRRLASLSMWQAPTWGPRPHFNYYIFRQLCVWGERPFRGEDECVVYKSCWPSPVQSFLGPSPARLVTILYLDARHPQPTGPGPRIYIRQVQSGPVIPPDTGFLSHRLLLAIRTDRVESTAPVAVQLLPWKHACERSGATAVAKFLVTRKIKMRCK
jgi:hypothetical protein